MEFNPRTTIILASFRKSTKKYKSKPFAQHILYIEAMIWKKTIDNLLQNRVQ